MSRPMFRLRYAAGALMVFGTLALAACGGSTGGTTGGTTSVSGTSSNPQAQMIAQKVQQEHLQSADVNLQASLKTQNLGSISTTNTGKMTLNPLALQLNSTASTGSNSIEGEAILIDNTAYVKQNGQSQWREASLPANTTESVPFVSLQNLSKAQNVQMEHNGQPETITINGKQVQAYHLRATGTQTINGQTAAYTEDIWVETAGASGGTATASATHTITATHTASAIHTATATHTATSTTTSTANKQYLPVKMTVTAQSSQGTLNSTAIFTNWNAGQTVTAPPQSAITK